MTDQLVKSMAHLLAASGCDLGDERSVLRTLEVAGNAAGDIVAYSDRATALARSIRTDATPAIIAGRAS